MNSNTNANEALYSRPRPLSETPNEQIGAPSAGSTNQDSPSAAHENDAFPTAYSHEVCEKMYEQLPVSKETIALIKEYFLAATNLYSRLSLRELYDLYNRQNEPLSLRDFLSVAEVLRHDQSQYYLILGQEAFYEDAPVSMPIDREIVAHYLWEFGNEYDVMVTMQQDCPLKILPKESFLRYADEYYSEDTPQQEALLQFVRSRCHSKVNSPEDILDDLILGARLDHDVSELIKEAKYTGIALKNRQEEQEFLRLLIALHNHTRKHVLRGYTLSELYSMRNMINQSPETAPPPDTSRSSNAGLPLTQAGTPSRNAPCPCGSGRKYKHCCGKK